MHRLVEGSQLEEQQSEAAVQASPTAPQAAVLVLGEAVKVDVVVEGVEVEGVVVGEVLAAHCRVPVSHTWLQQSPPAEQLSPAARHPPHVICPFEFAWQCREQHSVGMEHSSPSSSPQEVVEVEVEVVVEVVVRRQQTPASQSLLQQSAGVEQAWPLVKQPLQVKAPLAFSAQWREQHSSAMEHTSPSSSPQEVVVEMVVVVVVSVTVLE